jgi:hypothetical protein
VVGEDLLRVFAIAGGCTEINVWLSRSYIARTGSHLLGRDCRRCIEVSYSFKQELKARE